MYARLSGIHLIANGTLYRKINTGRKNGFTERQRWSQMRDKYHLCTPLTGDKCLPLPAVSGESSGDKGRFTPLTLTFDAPQKYIWLASSNTSEIRAKGVAKSAAKFCLRLLKVKGLPKVWSNGVRLKLRSKLQKFNKGAAKYVCFFPPLASRFSPVSPFAWIPRSPRASSECGVIASLGS